MGKRKRRKEGAADAPAKRAPERTDLRLAAGLALLAWLHRLAFLSSNRDRAWPYTVFYEGDSRTFFEYARALLAGRLHDSGIPFHPPGFPGFLAGGELGRARAKGAFRPPLPRLCPQRGSLHRRGRGLTTAREA